MTATTYEPEGKLTRAQFVKLLACSLEEAETLKTYEGQHPFTDSEGHWAETYIAWAKDKGIVEGVSATEFDPEAPDHPRADGHDLRPLRPEAGHRAAEVRQRGRVLPGRPTRFPSMPVSSSSSCASRAS